MRRHQMLRYGGCGINSMGWRNRYRVTLLHLLVHGLFLCKADDIPTETVINVERGTGCSTSPLDATPLIIHAFDLSAGSLLHSFSKPLRFSNNDNPCGNSGSVRRTLVGSSEYSKHFFITTGGEGLGMFSIFNYLHY